MSNLKHTHSRFSVIIIYLIKTNCSRGLKPQRSGKLRCWIAVRGLLKRREIRVGPTTGWKTGYLPNCWKIRPHRVCERRPQGRASQRCAASDGIRVVSPVVLRRASCRPWIRFPGERERLRLVEGRETAHAKRGIVFVWGWRTEQTEGSVSTYGVEAGVTLSSEGL